MSHLRRLRQAAILSICVWSLVTPLYGETARESFQPKHLARLKSVVAARISPDGEYVAYGLAIQREPLKEDDGPPWVELHVVDKGGQSRGFVTGKVNVGEIQWTPDGKRIAFVAKRQDDKHSCLYEIPIDGGEARRVLQHDTALWGVAYSPDGRRVAFLARREVDQAQKEVRDKGFNQEIFEEDTPPTLVWIAEIGGKGKPRALDLRGSASYVEWSPLGHELAVVLAPSPSVDDSYMFRRVHVVHAETGRITASIPNPGKLGQVGWSPQGTHLALISAVDIHDPSEGRLMIASVSGEVALKDLIPHLEGHATSFCWVDPQTIRWVADEGEYTVFGESRIDGGGETFVRGEGPILSGISKSKDGAALAFLGHAPTHPPEVFYWDSSSKVPRRLTQSNPGLDAMQFASQEVVQWTARDGLRLGGVLIKPLNYVSGRLYPMIMVVHGGPEAHVPNGWVTSYSNPGQVGAARGFVVFYPNYRGSTGRGVEFSKMGQADAAGREFDDLVDGIDHLVQQGLVDPKKVGITGGSYGGYASAWGATYYSERYAASVMFVGISDNISKVGTTDIPEEMFLVHHRKRLWDDWSYFLDRSPIRYVQRNRTPTLIMHGKEDPRVHPSQSLELHRHLKTLNQAPVRLVLYPGEGHGNRKAAARFDYCLRLLQWMEHYLQGPGGPPPAMVLDYQAALE